ncbi:hypothetical protein [Sphaerothrix gracilis]|uniref:hypothetical protein n=1 Tax=Sphaerothrix gracilis TaxID=3151835 RepID=UPI0031FC1D55
MTSLDRFKANLTNTQGSKCDSDEAVKEFEKRFEDAADKADQQLEDKQKREQKKFMQ